MLKVVLEFAGSSLYLVLDSSNFSYGNPLFVINVVFPVTMYAPARSDFLDISVPLCVSDPTYCTTSRRSYFVSRGT